MAATFVWEQLRRANRLPGAHALWRHLTRLRYRDGRILTIRSGPAAGLRWRHYDDYQTWMAMGLYEPHVAQFIFDTLEHGDTFYDVGGNAGYFTLIAARKVGPSGRVFTFDPLPRNIATIREQIALNQMEAIAHVEPVAIAGHESAFTLVVPSRHSTANAHLESYAPHVADEGERLTVKATTLDSFLREHPQPNLVKIDIEGAEVSALAGAERMLSGPDAPTLLVSTHSDELEAAVRAALTAHGYHFENMVGFEQMIVALPG